MILKLKLDAAYSFFCGVVVSGYLCAFLVFPWFRSNTDFFPALRDLKEPRLYSQAVPDVIIPEIVVEEPEDVSNDTPFAVPVPVSWHSLEALPPGNAILDAYRDELTRDGVMEFFSGIIRSDDLAASILTNAEAFDISPSLAFALCWEESRFNPWAVNHYNRDGSIDRGLFQLNDRSFSNLGDGQFFDPQINAYYGLAHLRFCLDTGGSVVAGLAMYNAGTGRVSAGETPKRTLDYISHILESQQKIEELFEARIVTDPEPEVVVLEEPIPIVEKPRLTRLSPLTPISGKPFAAIMP
jgi:hypothetical protein